MTATAALEEGVLTPETKIWTRGGIPIIKAPSRSAGCIGRRGRPTGWRR
ncbi:MAG: hypothetical protein ACLUNZ_01345 [Evtepia sp.]